MIWLVAGLAEAARLGIAQAEATAQQVFRRGSMNVQPPMFFGSSWAQTSSDRARVAGNHFAQ